MRMLKQAMVLGSFLAALALTAPAMTQGAPQGGSEHGAMTRTHGRAAHHGAMGHTMAANGRMGTMHGHAMAGHRRTMGSMGAMYGTTRGHMMGRRSGMTGHHRRRGHMSGKAGMSGMGGGAMTGH